jgi:hypothetical protein
MRIKKSILTVNLFLAGMAAAYLPACAAGQSIFQVVSTPNNKGDNDLFGVSASSPSDIWAVGQTVIHFDGATWTEFSAPHIKGQFANQLDGVADISPTDAWAVGSFAGTLLLGSGPISQPVIEHWDGTQWSVFPSAPFNKPGDAAALLAITAISANDIWAVGGATLVIGVNTVGGNLFEHWDGTAWTPTIAFLGGGFAAGAASADATDDIWAVGSSGLSSAQASPFVAHFNGANWKSVPSATLAPGASAAFNGVVALAPNNVWAVGSITDVMSGPASTLIEHYDGSEWSVVPSPSAGQNQSNDLFGITAVSPTDIWAFGHYAVSSDGTEGTGPSLQGVQKTLLLHWDGTSWTLVPSPSPEAGGILNDTLDAGVTTGQNVWIVGTQSGVPGSDAFTATLAIHSTTAAGAGSN